MIIPSKKGSPNDNVGISNGHASKIACKQFRWSFHFISSLLRNIFWAIRNLTFKCGCVGKSVWVSVCVNARVCV